MINRIPNLILTFALILCLHQSTSAKVVYVAQDAPGSQTGEDWQSAFTTITAGLTASASGDEVWVKSATYSEAISLESGVALYAGFEGNETRRDERGCVSNATVIDATGMNTHVVTALNIQNATIDGFTITGGDIVGVGGGMYCKDSSVHLENCFIIKNNARSKPYDIKSGSGGGIYANGGVITAKGCSISNNNARYMAGASFDSDVHLKECMILDNRAICSSLKSGPYFTQPTSS